MNSILSEKLRSYLGNWCHNVAFVIIIYSNYVHRTYTLIFHSFVALFKDEYKLPKGSEIELSRESNHVLKISSKFILFSTSPFSFVDFSTYRCRLYFAKRELFKELEICLYVAKNIHVSITWVPGNIPVLCSQSDTVAHILNQIDKSVLTARSYCSQSIPKYFSKWSKSSVKGTSDRYYVLSHLTFEQPDLIRNCWIFFFIGRPEAVESATIMLHLLHPPLFLIQMRTTSTSYAHTPLYPAPYSVRARKFWAWMDKITVCAHTKHSNKSLLLHANFVLRNN